MSSDVGSRPSSQNSMWALQVNGEIPRASKVGWEHLKPSQEQIFRSSNSKNLKIKNGTEDEQREITELEADDETPPESKVPHKGRLPSKKELDMSLPYRLPRKKTEVDLRPLISALLPIAQVVEDDTLWDTHSLLAETQLKMNQHCDNP